MADTRTRDHIGIEIAAERWAFLRADEAEDWAAADAHYRRMNALLEDYGRLPVPMPRTP